MQAADYVQFAVALIFVIGLIGLLAVLLRRFGGGGIAMPRYRPGQKRRLHVVDALPLDPRRRMLLVRRDNVEHLIVLGPQGETVVESGFPALETSIEDAGSGDGLSQRFDSVVRKLIKVPDTPANTEAIDAPQKEVQSNSVSDSRS